ncbi:MAG: hypothetical protein ND807_07890 [Vicinamibacterales bacterium]|nr:hypothetical protein [Vicinamibacterales bacterium]
MDRRTAEIADMSPTNIPGRVIATALSALFVTMMSLAARADDEVSSSKTTPLSATSAESGAFLPWTMGARSDSQRALVFAQGGYNGAENGAVFQTVGEAQIFGRLALRLGGSYFGPSDTFRPEAGLRVDALRQERHGVDLAVLGVYETKGFNTVRAITARIAVSRAFGDTRVVSNLGYGFGLEEGERYGDFRLAGLHALTAKLQIGLDSRLRIDLERDDDEPPGEPDWEILAGPLATYSIDRYIVSATAGYSALKYRLVEGRHTGAIATLGVGAVF